MKKYILCASLTCCLFAEAIQDAELGYNSVEMDVKASALTQTIRDECVACIQKFDSSSGHWELNGVQIKILVQEGKLTPTMKKALIKEMSTLNLNDCGRSNWFLMAEKDDSLWHQGTTLHYNEHNEHEAFVQVIEEKKDFKFKNHSFEIGQKDAIIAAWIEKKRNQIGDDDYW